MYLTVFVLCTIPSVSKEGSRYIFLKKCGQSGRSLSSSLVGGCQLVAEAYDPASQPQLIQSWTTWPKIW